MEYCIFEGLLCWLLILVQSPSIYGEMALHKRSSLNKVTDVNTTCDRNSFRVTVKTQEDFNGAIYAKDYPTECKILGEGSHNTELVISSQECGVKIVKEGEDHVFKVLIYVQYDPSVQQMSDEQLQVTCSADGESGLRFGRRSSIGVFNDKPPKEVNSILEVRKTKVKPLNLSEFYPSNFLQIPSKLQQMVNDHFQRTKVASPSSPSPGTTTTTTQDPNATSNVKPIIRKKLQNSHVISSGITIKDSGNAVTYKGIFRASPKVITELGKDNENGSLNQDTWRPLTLIEPLPSHENKWKTDLNKEDEEEKVSCWLDVVKGDSPLGEAAKDELLVGETATLIVKARTQTKLGTKVTSCRAHDGSGKNVQELVDRDGCSVDEEIMPTLKRKQVDSSDDSDEEISYAPFKVFKFPDHDNLHLKCTVLICVQECEKPNCNKRRKARQMSLGFFVVENDGRIFTQNTEPITDDTSARNQTKKETRSEKPSINAGKVVDVIDVFNSVKVRAPAIDNYPRLVKDYQKDERDLTETESDDEVFCLTSTKLLVSFGILLTILFVSLLCALYWCIQDRIRRKRIKRTLKCHSSPPHLPHMNHIPHTRFHGVTDYTKFPHLPTPYHRFPH